MDWEFDNDRAIYSQIVEQMKLFIVSGKLESGTRLSSVRELATDAEVNPNTMQRALSELEGTGLVFTNRTSGRFITDDAEKIADLKEEFAKTKIAEFFSQMEKLGIGKEETVEKVKNYKWGGNTNE